MFSSVARNRRARSSLIVIPFPVTATKAALFSTTKRVCLRRGEIMNFISIVERDDWQVESWTVEGTKGELANDFRGWHQDVHTLIDRLDTPYKWALMVRVRWSPAAWVKETVIPRCECLKV